MMDVLTLIAFLLLCTVIGALAFRVALGKQVSFLQTWSYALPIGVGVVVIELFALNTLFEVQLTSLLVWLVTLLLFVIAVLCGYVQKVQLSNLTQVRKMLRVEWLSLSRPFQCLVGIWLLLSVIMTIHAVVVPIYKHDAFLYHLPIAKETFDTGFFPTSSPSYLEIEKAYPPLGYFFYTLSYFAIGSEELLVAKILPLLFGFSLIGALYHVVRRLLNKSAEIAWSSVLLLGALYYFSNMMLFENTDIFTAFYFFAATALFLQFLSTRTVAYLYFGVVMVGFCYWTKYTSLIWMVVFALLLGWGFFIQQANIKKSWSLHYVLAGLLGLFTIFPHLFHNYLTAKNPLFPLFHSLFSTVDPWYDRYVFSGILARDFAPLAIDILLRHAVLLVPLLTVWVLWTKKSIDERRILFVGICSLILWALLLRVDGASAPNTYRYLLGPMALLVAICAEPLYRAVIGKDKMIATQLGWVYAITAGALVSIFFVPQLYSAVGYSRIIEYSLTLAVVVGVSAHLLFSQRIYSHISQKKFRVLLENYAPVVVFLLLLTPFVLSLLVYPMTFYKSGELGQDFSSVLYEPSYSWMLENIKPTDTIMVFHERQYLFPSKVIAVDSPKIVDVHTMSSAKDMANFLLQKGVTHVFVSEHSKEVPLYDDSALFSNLEQSNFDPVFSESSSHLQVTIYKVQVI